jgi:putative transposase
VWATILASNLIRTTVAGAAILHRKQPRKISFTAACQYILSTWMLLSASRTPAATVRDLRLRLLQQIASCEVANRPGRFEPRVIKRRKHRYPLMSKPRADLRRRLATSLA